MRAVSCTRATSCMRAGCMRASLETSSCLALCCRRHVGQQTGIDEDEMLALEFGSSDVAMAYKDKLKARLQARADEMKLEEEERMERLAKSYLLGKEAYECVAAACKAQHSTAGHAMSFHAPLPCYGPCTASHAMPCHFMPPSLAMALAGSRRCDMPLA
eukprot:365028-Chlamydomonas_euryale.AAC.42